MTVFGIGISYGLATLFAMFSGMPIAFALGAVAVVFMAIYMPAASLDTVTQNVYEEMASITLLSIPLFILKGAAIGKSRAGQDLYSALHAWLHRVPGGLGVANVFACALFAAMAGSSVWQAGGVASRSKAIVAPEDAKGLKVRGGSREMDMVLQTAGAAVLSVPSNEIYAAMQTGACDAGITSSTSLISFRLEEVAKSLTSGAGASYWFMLEPLMMSKAIFDKLPKNQQDIILAVGAELEAFGRKGAQDDDAEVAKVYEKAGAKVSALDAAIVGKWRDIARDTAWKDYGAKTATSANLLKLASDVAA